MSTAPEVSTTSWGDTKTGTPASLTAILLEGRLTHEWSLPFGGREIVVVYDLFPSGTRVDIDVKTSGLDLIAKKSLGDLFTLAHALFSFDGWTFPSTKERSTLDQKIEFLRGFQDPMWALFMEEYQTAKLKQHQEFEKRRKLLGESTPDRR